MELTQEEKQLLLKDLCARLPYGVVCKISYTLNNETTNWEDVESTCDDIITKINFDTKEVFSDWLFEYSSINDVKPYLRLMSSMTEEEKEELKQEHLKDERLFAECLTKAANGDSSMRGKVIPHFAADWCDEHHFDYRGLIPMGLALEALPGMYKTE